MPSIQFAPTQLASLKKTGLSVLAVLLLLCFKLLLEYNMGGGGWNEVDVLPLARQFADPDWLPTDWYLQQPPGYRLLFQVLFGGMTATWGFLATSLIGRLICYTLVAIGFGLLGQKLGLSSPTLLLSIALFLTLGCRGNLEACTQGAIAHEWLVGGLEAKAVAYSFLPLAIWLLLQGNYLWLALLLGMITSLHVLIGGWTFLVMMGWLLLNRKTRLSNIRSLAVMVPVYLLGSVFAIGPSLNQVLSPAVSGDLQPSFIYVFLRLPHHLNPLSWAPEFWIRPILYLLVLGVSLAMLRRQQSRQPLELAEHYRAAIGLAQLTFISLIPFAVGLAIAPFDSQGQLLQYYPFRLGDVLLPLSVVLLLSCALEHQSSIKKPYALVSLLLVGMVCVLQAFNFPRQIADLQHFPAASLETDVDWPEWTEMSHWIKTNTPQQAIIISPPEELTNFTWMAERATIAKFKLFPQTKSEILHWAERLTDLSGGIPPWADASRTKDNRDQIRKRLTAGYNSLETAQVVALMNKYQANYMLTRPNPRLQLPIAHRNASYILHARPTS